MSTVKSKLVYRVVKSGPQIVVLVPTKRGMDQRQATRGEVSADLFEEIKKPEKALHDVEVEFELEGGIVKRLRRAGQPFEASRPSVAAPLRAGNNAERGTRSNTPPRQQRRDAQRAEQASQETPKFHNSYNFVPAPPRPTGTSGLEDSEPVGHDRYADDHWSGQLTFMLKAVTPLLIPDSAAANVDGSKHQTFPLRVGPDGKPLLAVTTVKGMLRAAYEAITNSRFGIFARHENRLGFRRETEDGARLVPARIEIAAGSRQVRLLPGDLSPGSDGSPPLHAGKPLQYAAWLRRYESRGRPTDKGEATVARKYAFNPSLPAHREEVYVRLSERKEKTRVYYFEVEDIVRDTGQTCPTNYHKGWVCVSGPNAGNKHHERVFLLPQTNPNAFLCDLPQEVESTWTELIKNYDEVNLEAIDERRHSQHGVRAKPTSYLGHKPGQTAWSRHVVNANTEKQLTDGALCYAEVEQQATGGFRVRALYPVALSRELYSSAPNALLDPSLRPAMSLRELSPADRVFGWVRDRGDGAYRGQLRIREVACVTPADKAIARVGTVAINNLGQPKPQQVRFYVAANRSGKAQAAKLSKRKAGYSQAIHADATTSVPLGTDHGATAEAESKALRGRKIYPHHASLQTEYWNPWPNGKPRQAVDTQTPVTGRFYREYLRPLNAENQCTDSQNRSVEDWVAIDTEFKVTVDVINLTAVEIGALIWLLSLDESHCLRIGGGKPLGFGSINVHFDGIALKNGQAIRNEYRSFFGRITPQASGGAQTITSAEEAAALIAVYKRIVTTTYRTARFEDTPFIAAFLRACNGFDDRLPVHYPRSGDAPSREGKNYEWFMENDKSGKRHVLGDLANDAGLPLLLER